ncbi:SDR family NAD(P)-dependent oxidoreductase [Streptomyces sp. RGM 3693]|uniref:type I polyketide synthase n=1 Tax=Streptomyces sp. RGM 3693 TaxID=3413284 RepID=UPI003D2BF26A
MNTGLEIAIVGMACRYPGAENVDQFWKNLRDGVESLTHFDTHTLTQAGVPPALLNAPDYVKTRGILHDPALFDAEFFQITPREAELIDPQHRIFLECAWEALEDSGYASHHRPDATGIFAGAYENTYLRHLQAHPHLTETAGWLLTHLSNEPDYLATRTSYKLDLRGPSVSVHTACSTSLVAVHLAGQALLSGNCDLALAGGSTVRANQREGYRYEPEGILSPDGHCRSFDAQAQGTVSSSGVGIVVLKRLQDALADRDTIHAVIKGSAINNDGAAKVGFSAPSVTGQARAIRAAHLMADIDPATITYVEAHGSATALGDPIEVEGLTRAFRAGTDRTGHCALGSVKSNIGHTHAAAGVAGLIKTTLALRHQHIPPSLHYHQPNPDIDFTHSPFHVTTELTSWKTDGTPRRAGVSSFGTGGTNAHAVLEEAPTQPPTPSDRPWHLLLLSGRTEAALETATDRLATHLNQHPHQQPADIAYTLQAGRKHFTHRQALVYRDAADAADALTTRDPRRLLRQHTDQNHTRPVAFMFSGLGDQYPHLAHDLYQCEPVFRREIDRCATLFQPHLDIDLRTLLYPDEQPPHPTTPDGAGIDLRRMLGRTTPQPPQAERLHHTRYAQPVTFMVEWALAHLWMDWGIRPQALIGYSIGEWVAACLAEVLSLEDATFLVAHRATLIDRLDGGAMLAVSLPEADARTLDDRLSIAALNGPALTVLAGPTDAVAETEERLTRDQVACRRLKTTHAFHSHMMEPARDHFVELTRTITLHPPRLPYLSNVTGTWITDAQATDPTYWARHMCQTVRFASGIQELWQATDRILLEIGPGQAYSSLALQLLPDDAHTSRISLSSLPAAHDNQSAAHFLLGTLGRLWLAGLEPHWDRVHAGQTPGRVPLPTYPFQRQRYWIEPTPTLQPQPQAQQPAPTGPLSKRPDIADWFSLPAWTSTAPPAPVNDEELAHNPQRWLLFLDDLGVGERLAHRLRRTGHHVTTVAPADRFAHHTDGHFTLTPDRREDYHALLTALGQHDRLPHTVAHLWTVTADTPQQLTRDRFDALQRRGFHSLLALTQAWGALGTDDPLHLAVVSNGLRHITDDEPLNPEKATLAGPCLVAPQEHPHLTTQSIDIGPATPHLHLPDPALDRLLTELVRRPTTDPIVAHRGRTRFTPHWKPLRIDHPEHRPPRLRDHGVYLITGGLGGIGLTLAAHLARTAHARLVLVSRSALPAENHWDHWLTTHDAHDTTATKIRKITALKELGAQVLVLRADVADETQMRTALTTAQDHFGPLNGVIHAAGVPGAGLIQLKKPHAADTVLAPKTHGTLVLDTLLHHAPLDFLLLCSSTIAFSGGLGQVDYCSANAFLDAYAQYRSAADGPYTLAVNWDAWQEVGMAVNTVGPTPRPRTLDHPLLHTCLADTPTHAVYATQLTSPQDWLVDEHRMLGHPVIPGTAYLEMARAAVADQGHGQLVRFEDVLFLAPVVLDQDGTCEVHLILEKHHDAYQFSVASSTHRPGTHDTHWTEHVTGRVRPTPQPDDDAPRPTTELIDHHALHDAGDLTHNGPMTFGPRSPSIERAWVGEGHAVAQLAVPEPYTDEVTALGLHPFLLDIATGFASLYLERDYLMPLRYRAIDLYAPLPPRIFSSLTYRAHQEGTPRETLSFDVTLFDEAGHVLLTAEDFVMKKARALNTKLIALRDGTSEEVNAFTYPQLPGTGRQENAFLTHLETGILPAEGVDALERALARDLSPQVAIATKDLTALMHNVGALPPPSADPTPHTPARTHARPPLPTPYVAPTTPTQTQLADLWRDHIGVEPVGIHDNFYDLGGHSLLGIKLVNRLRETFHVQITLHTLFDNLTVAALADAITAQLPKPEHT